MDKFDLAIYNMAHNFPGGVQALAPLIRMNTAVLYNQVNPNTAGHVPNVRTFRAMLLATKNLTPLDELEKENGRAAFKLPDFSKVGDAALLEICARMQKEYGDIGAKLSEALQNGDISLTEALGLEKEGLEMIAVIVEFISRVKGIAK